MKIQWYTVHQKNRKEIHDIVKSCILNTIRDGIPVEQLLRAYLDETTDLLKEEKKEEKTEVKKENIKFNDTDMAISVDNVPETIVAPKDIPTLEKIAVQKNAERKAQEALEAEEDKIKIIDEILPPVQAEDLNEIKLDIEELS